jgi:glyoxylase-like metal-dependent hydrolase (beta-lactamase superfamily II)
MSGSPIRRPLDVRWIHGSESAKHNTDPDIQVYSYDADTYILRQNKAINYEAPFMYLLCGRRRAVLIDTGATESAQFFPLRRTVDEVLAARAQPPAELLVLHTHPHGDHIAGDGQFADRPAISVVGARREHAWPYFGFDTDPDRVAQVDLGGRTLEVIATPGHHDAAVTFYDAQTGLLLTGDTVYPGRLYVRDWPAFARSIERLIEFGDQRPVTHVLGCHIEMSTDPGVDYPVRTTYQPDEPPLELTLEHLREIRHVLDSNAARPGRYVRPQFIVCPY